MEGVKRVPSSDEAADVREGLPFGNLYPGKAQSLKSHDSLMIFILKMVILCCEGCLPKGEQLHRLRCQPNYQDYPILQFGGVYLKHSKTMAMGVHFSTFLS